jgi:CRP-like cAMP-binding protein
MINPKSKSGILRGPVAPTEATPSPAEPMTDSAMAQSVSSVFVAPSEAQMDDFFAFCKNVNPKEFEKLLHEGQLTQFGPSSIVYPQGDSPDSFFVINDGQVEVVVADRDGHNPVPLTNLFKGELFGETSLLLNQARDATVRVPEGAALLKFDRDTFLRLISTVPEFGHFLAIMLSRRLEKTTAQLHFYSNTCELSGSLDFFDLPTIFQTLSISLQHGMMYVFSLTQGILGEFAFSSGNPVSARFRHLNGVEAMLDLFQAEPKVNFGFARTAEPPVVENPISIGNVNEFVMHAIHLKDEMQVIIEKLNIPEDKYLKRIHAHLEWTNPELANCAKDLWSRIMKEPQQLRSLLETLPYCRYNILMVLDHLLETKQVAYAELTAYGYR